MFLTVVGLGRLSEMVTYYRGVSKKYPSLLHNDEKSLNEVLVKDDLKNKLLYRYPTSLIYCVFDRLGLYQTTLSALYRKRQYKLKVDYDREIFKLKDGGQVGIDWRTTDSRSASDRPIVVIHHGLCGHSQSYYVKSMISELEKAGFYCVVFIARGCGKVPLSTPETFTAARTIDMQQVLAHITRKCPEREIHAVGFSLGATILLKYLGEYGDKTGLTSAVAICPSFDCHITRTTNTFQYFSSLTVMSLQSLVKQHRDVLENNPESKLDWQGMMRARNIREFDEAAIVGKDKNDYLHHPTVEDYYEQSSCIRFTKGVTVRTLAICAGDDPVCSTDGAPSDLSSGTVGPGLAILKVAHGGHVGFAADFLFPSRYWCDEAAAQWMRANSSQTIVS